MDKYNIPDEKIRRARSVNLEKYLPTKGFNLYSDKEGDFIETKITELDGILVRISWIVNTKLNNFYKGIPMASTGVR